MDNATKMNFDEYSRQVDARAQRPGTFRMRPDLFQAVLGLSVQSGRLLAMCKVYANGGMPPDKTVVRESLREVLFNLQLACNDQGIRVIDLIQPAPEPTAKT